MSNNGKLHQDYIVHTFVNLGICLYKFGFLEESLALFEKSILILKSPLKSKPLHFTANATFNGSNNSEYFSDLANKIKYKKIKCSLHMQCCLILSEAEKYIYFLFWFFIQNKGMKKHLSIANLQSDWPLN